MSNGRTAFGQRFRRHISRDTVIGIVMLCVAVIYWLEAGKIRISPLDGPVGASGLPRSLAWVLGLLAIALVIRSVIQTREPVSSQADIAFKDWIKPHLRALGMLAIGVGYLLILPWAGYAISIAALLLAVSLYNGASFNVRTLLVAVLGSVFCYFLFVKFLGIALPHGKLFAAVMGTD